MKKLMFAAALMLAGTGLFAQAQPKPKEKANLTTVKKESPAAPAKVVPISQPATGTPTKKDGTADMRYKANKQAAKPAPVGPVKKDGSADMRYKANKEAKKKN
jgi:hypothetical protein